MAYDKKIQEIKTLISATNKEAKLQEIMNNANLVVRNNQTTFLCQQMSFIVAYFADSESNIVKVASNYVNVNVNAALPTSSIIYMQELMFTNATQIKFADEGEETTLSYGEIKQNSMFTNAYDYNNGLAIPGDLPASNSTLRFVVFDNIKFVLHAIIRLKNEIK